MPKKTELHKNISYDQNSNDIKEINEEENINNIEMMMVNDEDNNKSQEENGINKEIQISKISEEDIIINNDEPETKKNSCRQRVDALLNGKFKKLFEFISFLLSVAIYIIYVVTTYNKSSKFQWYNIINSACSIYFLLLYALNASLAHHITDYIFASYQLLYLLTL